MIKNKSTKKKIKLEDIIKKGTNKQLYKDISELIDKRGKEISSEYKQGVHRVNKNDVDNEFICFIGMVDKKTDKLDGRVITYCSHELINEAIKRLMKVYLNASIEKRGMKSPMDELLLKLIDTDN